jgi:ACR3 family arsenite efflux pump ArsB
VASRPHSTSGTQASGRRPGPALGTFERYLTVWRGLAMVVGVLVEVPVMLSVVQIVLRTRSWYEHQTA